jgi:hypothetical protein
MNIIFHQVLTTGDDYVLQTIKIYEDSFPANERQPVSILVERINQSKYKLYFGLLNNEVARMALLWDFANLEFVLLNIWLLRISLRYLPSQNLRSCISFSKMRPGTLQFSPSNFLHAR